MIKDKSFINSLISEMKEWVNDGLITSDQQKKIESRYAVFPETQKQVTAQAATPPPKKEIINIARVVIGLATLSLAIGIIIFYASNWRRMPPVLKIVQVFILMLSIYGSAFFFLDPKRRHPSIGSALLLLGIVSYGTGIMLVAQIYHISSHPANGLLAWGFGALLVSAAAREKYGYYLSALLFFIWNFWELTVFGSAGYFYIIPVIVIAFLLLEIGDRPGITCSALLAGWYIFQTAIYWIFHYAKNGRAEYFLVLLFVLAGAGFITAAKYLYPHEEVRGAGRVLRFFGWGAWFLPLLQLAYTGTGTGHSIALWGTAVLAASFFLKEYEGYYVSAAIFFFWSLVEFSSRGNLPWLYILPVAVTGYLFYQDRNRTGAALTSLSLVWYFIFFTWFFVGRTAFGGVSFDSLFMLLMIPAGGVMILSGRMLLKNPPLSDGGNILHAAGWLFFLAPFFTLSWQFTLNGISPFLFFRTSAPLSTEYIVLTTIIAAALLLTKRRGEPMQIPFMIFIFASAGFLMPMGHTATRMVAFHCGIIIAAGVMLYYSYSIPEFYRLERGVAVTFILAMIIVKGAGFISYSGIDEKFRLAYLAGYILFVTVCFLVNRLVHHFLSNRLYPHNTIDAVCAAAIWFSVYLSSFETRNQVSIFSADRIVIIMIILFVSAAALLYGVLIPRIRSGRVMILLSLGVLACSGLTMLIAGPSVPWEVYSVTFNLLLIIISVTYIYYSTVIQSKTLLNAAIAGFVIHVITRYFDLFWDMFSGALLFIITGFIGLFGGYILERKRKDLSMMIEKSAPADQEVQ